MESGSCVDLVSEGTLTKAEAARVKTTEETTWLDTANGVTGVDKAVNVKIGALNDVMDVMVMKESPNVLSLGKRVMNEGYTFEWKAGSLPVLTSPDGERFVLQLHHLVPVLPVGESGPAAAPSEAPNSGG